MQGRNELHQAIDLLSDDQVRAIAVVVEEYLSPAADPVRERLSEVPGIRLPAEWPPRFADPRPRRTRFRRRHPGPALTIRYFDASAWVKRYFQEPGTTAVNYLFARGARFASTGLAHVEVVAALSRQQSSRNISAPELANLQQRAQHDWMSFWGLPLSEQAVTSAASIARELRLRGADAIHLAAAVHLRDALLGAPGHVLLVASDGELLAAAAKVDLQAESPSQGANSELPGDG